MLRNFLHIRVPVTDICNSKASRHLEVCDRQMLGNKLTVIFMRFLSSIQPLRSVKLYDLVEKKRHFCMAATANLCHMVNMCVQLA